MARGVPSVRGGPSFITRGEGRALFITRGEGLALLYHVARGESSFITWRGPSPPLSHVARGVPFMRGGSSFITRGEGRGAGPPLSHVARADDLLGDEEMKGVTPLRTGELNTPIRICILIENNILELC